MKSPQQQKPLKDTLLARIEAEGVSPRSKMFYLGRECVVWILWLLSAVVGALAIAVSLYVYSHSQYAIYEAAHMNTFTYLVEALPYIWVLTFVLMVVVGLYNLRHTKKGYKYPLWTLLASSVVLSILFGLVMQKLGVGYVVDDILGKNVSMYMSQDKMTEKMWQNPDEGRLIGNQVLSTVSPTSTVVFEDIRGKRWQVTVSDLPENEVSLLASGKDVLIIGRITNTDVSIFHACGAFSSMGDKEVTAEYKQMEKTIFLDRIYTMKADTNLASGETKAVKICASLEMAAQSRKERY
jgi:hypothetical protein